MNFLFHIFTVKIFCSHTKVIKGRLKTEIWPEKRANWITIINHYYFFIRLWNYGNRFCVCAYGDFDDPVWIKSDKTILATIRLCPMITMQFLGISSHFSRHSMFKMSTYLFTLNDWTFSHSCHTNTQTTCCDNTKKVAKRFVNNIGPSIDRPTDRTNDRSFNGFYSI